MRLCLSFALACTVVLSFLVVPVAAQDGGQNGTTNGETTFGNSPEPVIGSATVIDGETLFVEGKRIALAGLDAPDMADPRGPQARQALADLISSRQVFCEPTGRQSFGRQEANCFIEDGDRRLNITAEMIRSGWGFSQWRSSDRYMELENTARDLQLGFWAPTLQSPLEAEPTSWWQIGAQGLFVLGAGVIAAISAVAASLITASQMGRIESVRRDARARALTVALYHEIESMLLMVEDYVLRLPDFHKHDVTISAGLARSLAHSRPVYVAAGSDLGQLDPWLVAALSHFHGLISRQRAVVPEGMPGDREVDAQALARALVVCDQLVPRLRRAGQDIYAKTTVENRVIAIFFQLRGARELLDENDQRDRKVLSLLDTVSASS